MAKFIKVPILIPDDESVKEATKEAREEFKLKQLLSNTDYEEDGNILQVHIEFVRVEDIRINVDLIESYYVANKNKVAVTFSDQDILVDLTIDEFEKLING